MKVCLFADAQSVHIQQLAPALASRGIDVHVVTHKPAAVLGCSVERFSIPKVGPNYFRRWRGRHRAYLASFLRNFDVVNIQFLQDWGFWGSCDEVLAEEGCLVATAWGSDIIDPPGETPASRSLIDVRVEMLRRAAVATACGPTFARTVENYAGLEAGSVQVVPFGVDLGFFFPDESVGMLPDRTPCVGFCKGFRPVYGADRLVRAMPLVLERVEGARFELVGDGVELPRCRELAKSLGVDERIRWHGRQPLASLPKILQGWDVSVIPSVHEAFGVAALESAAMGVPVVASDVCGLRDTVRDGQTGLLVDSSEPARLADGILELLGDAPRRKRMATAGRAMVEREFQWCHLVDRWIGIYEMARALRCTMV